MKKQSLLKSISKIFNSSTEDSNIIFSDSIESYSTDKVDEQYQKAVFLFSQKNKPIQPYEKYPRYLHYELGITNPIKFHESMIEQGYLGQTESGKYSLTDKGKSYLDEYDYCVLLHKNTNLQITLEEYINVKKSHPPYLKFNDIVWSILNDRLNNSYLSCDWYVYRSTLWGMENILYKEKKYHDSLRKILEILRLDLSGCLYNFTFASLIIERIVELEGYFNEEVLDKAYIQPLPIQLCDKSLMRKIVIDMFNEPVFDEEKYIKILEKRKKLLIK